MGDYRVPYHANNAVANPPEVYSLRGDFQGDCGRCIVGRAVWLRADISEK